MIQTEKKYNNKQILSKITAVVLGASILLLSLLRENVFLEINAISDGFDYNQAYFYFFNESIAKLTPSQLSLLKWSLTFSFIFVISGFTFLAIYLWFKNKKYNRITLVIYLALFSLTGFTSILIWLTGTYSDYYFVIRKMIGFLQSPLPLFFFFTMFFYLKNVRINP